LHPAVLRLVQMTIDAADAAGIPVSMCGEMAGDPRYTRLLLGMGLRAFSMQPGSLPEIKAVVRDCDLGRARALVKEMMQHLDYESPERVVEDLNR
jgi:phosphotransferase system enzyme I (PtsI)